MREDLIVTVDLGPFKQKFDNGIPMRKAAFQLLETMFENLESHVDINKIVEVVISLGLGDANEEVIVLALSILTKLSARAGVVVLSQMDNIVRAFEKLFASNLKLIASKQSQERAQNILRAVLRVVYIIINSAEFKDQPVASFDDFFRNTVMSQEDSKNLYEKIAASYKFNSLD